MASKTSLPGGARCIAIHGDGGNLARLVDHDGYVWIETCDVHGNVPVYTLVKVSRDRFVAGMLGWLL